MRQRDEILNEINFRFGVISGPDEEDFRDFFQGLNEYVDATGGELRSRQVIALAVYIWKLLKDKGITNEEKAKN